MNVCGDAAWHPGFPFFPARTSELAVIPASPRWGWLEVIDEEAVTVFHGSAIGTMATPRVLPDMANLLIIAMLMKYRWDLHGPVHASAADGAEGHHP